jgi:Co/Zn/Cd efflux system component
MISEEKTCLTLTLKSMDPEKQDRNVVSNVKKMLAEDFEITHSTIEMAYPDELERFQYEIEK